MMSIKDPSRARKKLNLRFIFISFLLITQITIYIMLWTQMITNHQLRTGMDFIAMYTAGRIAQTDGISQVYDVDRQQAIQTNLVGFEKPPEHSLLYIHLPFTIPILQALVSTSYTASFIRWAIFLVILAALSTLILVRSLAWKSGPTWLSYAGAITIFPLFESILHGQDTVIALLGLAICFYGLNRNEDILAGFGLALATVRPHIALVLAIPFIFRRRRVFVGFLVGAASLALLSLILLGMDGTLRFVEFLLYYEGSDGYGVNEDAMFNFLGILVRLLPEHTSITQIAAWVAYVFSIIGLSIWWTRSKEITTTHFGIATLVSIFAVTHLHFHDLTLLLIPIFSLMCMLVNQFKWHQQNAALFPLIYSAILLLGINPALWYIIPYLIMFSLLLWLWKPENIHNLADRTQQLIYHR